MDFTLLYASKLAVKNSAGFRRIAVAAVLGACFAVVFPLLGLNAVLSVIVKVVSGLLICLVAGKFGGFKGYVKFTGAFLILTAVLGGALIGIFSLAGIDYSAGEGYILSSVPVGIPLFGALLLIIGARRLSQKFSKGDKKEVACKIYSGGNAAELRGLFDSGNRVFFHGLPVSVIDLSIAEKLTDVEGITEGVKIHTVTGSKSLKVFTADKIEIDKGGKIKVYKDVKLGISPQKIDVALLHPDLLED